MVVRREAVSRVSRFGWEFIEMDERMRDKAGEINVIVASRENHIVLSNSTQGKRVGFH